MKKLNLDNQSKIINSLLFCKHSEFIGRLISKIQTEKEYWIFTEIFCYLHGNNDVCNCKEQNIELNHMISNLRIDQYTGDYLVDKNELDEMLKLCTTPNHNNCQRSMVCESHRYK